MARTRNQGSKWIRRSTRLAIYHRDGWCCAYCGAPAEDGAVLTLDHVLACELGGSNESSNLVTACLSCNSAKRDATTKAWFATLRDRGIDTAVIGARIRRLVARPIDRAEGRRLESERTAARAA
jgi:5-methylcytosine-specific restriction endonuclease McrA